MEKVTLGFAIKHYVTILVCFGISYAILRKINNKQTPSVKEGDSFIKKEDNK